MELPNLKPLPKEKTPDPIVIPKREKEVKKPASLPNDDVKNTPMPIIEHIEPVEEKKLETKEEHHETPTDASAIADAIIMSHTATTAKSQPKHSLTTIIAIIIGLIVAAAVLLLSGVIKIGDNTPAKPEQIYPSGKLAKTICEQNENYEFKRDNSGYFLGIDIEDEITYQHVCEPKEEVEEQLENPFRFNYLALRKNYEDIEGLREYLSSTTEYCTILEDSDEYFKCLTSTSPYIYLAVYKQAIVLLYANDIDTAETLLKELKFPDRSYATE